MAAGAVVVLVGAALAVVPPSGPPDVGAVQTGGTGGAGTASASPPGPTVGAPPATDPAPTTDPAPVGGTPLQVRITPLGLVADVDAVTVDRGGRLHIPADPGRVGWWIGAARPGDPAGTVLVAGHVDTAEAGRGALFRLETLAMGAPVEVVAAGRVFRYRVTARRSYAKTRLPADLFDAGGPPRLVLVTCGGRFDDGAYASNVVVYAEPF
jgi:hypothetical protein